MSTSGGGMGLAGDPCVPAEANCAQGFKCAPLLGEDTPKGFVADLSAGRCVMAPANAVQPFQSCAAPMVDQVAGVDVLIEPCVPGTFCLHGLEKTQASNYPGSCRPICSGMGAAEPCPPNPLNGPQGQAPNPPPMGTNGLCLFRDEETYGLCYPWCNPLLEPVPNAMNCRDNLTELDGCFNLQSSAPNDPGIVTMLCMPWEEAKMPGDSCAAGSECGDGMLCIDEVCRQVCDASEPNSCPNGACTAVLYSGLFPNPPGPGYLDTVGYCP